MTNHSTGSPAIRQAISTRFCEAHGSRYYPAVAVKAAHHKRLYTYDICLPAESNHARAAAAFADEMGWEGELIQAVAPDNRADYVFIMKEESPPPSHAALKGEGL